jgi:hypothetical protein
MRRNCDLMLRITSCSVNIRDQEIQFIAAIDRDSAFPRSSGAACPDKRRSPIGDLTVPPDSRWKALNKAFGR